MRFVAASIFIIGIGIFNPNAYAHSSEPYRELRAHLIQRGWEPLVTNDVMADGTPEKAIGDARVMVGAGFVEVEFCSGVEQNYCVFNWKKKSDCLQIKTEGEFDAAHNSPTVLSIRDRLCSLISQGRSRPKSSQRP